MSDLGIADPDIVDVLQNLADRVSDIEQTVTDPEVMTGPLTDTFPGGITIGTTQVDGTIPTSPTAIVVSPSTHFDDIVADISWTPAVGTTAVEYQVEIAWKLGGTYQSAQMLRTGGNQVRVTALRPDSTYGVRVYPINAIGIVGAAYPTAFQDFATTHDSTTPSLPTGFTLTAGVRSIVAVWADVADVDVVNGNGWYELTIATDAGFTIGVRSKFFGGSIGGFTDLSPQTQYWAKVRAVDATGNPGPYTAASSVTTAAVSTGDMAVNSVDATVIADASILTAKIGNLQVTDAKINTLTVAKVTAGTIISQDFVLGAGGQIKSASLGPGILLNDQGLSLYNASAVRTVYLDATTGSATFTGTITATAGSIGGFTISSTELSGAGIITGGTYRSASAGQRVEISGGAVNYIKFYTGSGLETLYGAISVGLSAPSLTISAPQFSGGSQSLIQMRGQDGGSAGFVTINSAGNITLSPGSGYSVNTNGTDLYTGIVYASGKVQTSDWFYTSGDAGWFNSNHGVGLFVQSGWLNNHRASGAIGGLIIQRSDQSGGWASAAIRSEESYAGFAMHQPGLAAFHMFAINPDVQWYRSDGAWAPVYCDVVDMSTEASKNGIRAMTAEEDGLIKIRKLVPKRYKRNGDTKVNAKWKDEVYKTKRNVPRRKIYRFQNEELTEDDPRVKAHKAKSPEQQSMVKPEDQILEMEDLTDARWGQLSDSDLAAMESQRTQEWMGLIAEDLADVYPEAVAFGLDGKPNGIRYRLLTIPLLLAVQQLDTRLTALESV